MVKTCPRKSWWCLLGSSSSDGQHGVILPQREIYIQTDRCKHMCKLSLKFQQSSPITSSLDHIISNVDCVHAKEKTALTHGFLSMQKSQKTPWDTPPPPLCPKCLILWHEKGPVLSERTPARENSLWCRRLSAASPLFSASLVTLLPWLLLPLFLNIFSCIYQIFQWLGITFFMFCGPLDSSHRTIRVNEFNISE